MSYPEQGQYINLHAHRKSSGQHEWVLTSLFAHEYTPDDDPNAAYSIGIHPMLIREDTYPDHLKQVMLATENCQVLAIGECGLDKRLDIPFDLQSEVFSSQVKIAETTGLPVVIHSVKSHNEIIGFMEDYKPGVPMIIHGYRGGHQMALDLVKHGCYLSFGAAVLWDEKTAATAKQIPLDKLFIETDEEEADIRDIYRRVADIRNLTIEELKSALFEGVMKLFRR